MSTPLFQSESGQALRAGRASQLKDNLALLWRHSATPRPKLRWVAGLPVWLVLRQLFSPVWREAGRVGSRKERRPRLWVKASPATW